MVLVVFSPVVLWVVELVMAEDSPVLAVFVVLLAVAWVSFSPEYFSSSVAGSEASRMRYHSNINIEKYINSKLFNWASLFSYCEFTWGFAIGD